MKVNGETEVAVHAQTEQGERSEQEIPSEHGLKGSLERAREAVRTEAGVNGCGGDHAGSECAVEVLDGSGGLHSGRFKELRKRDVGEEFAFREVIERGNVPLASAGLGDTQDPALLLSAARGDGFQQQGSEVGNVDDSDNASCAISNGRQGTHAGDTEESSVGKGRGDIVDASMSMEVERDVSQSLQAHRDEGSQLPTREAEVEGVAGCLEESKPKQLTKSALKQLAKQERYKEIKLQRKAAEKEKRHQETARKRREWEEKLAALPDEEKEKARLDKLSARKERKEEQHARKEKLKSALNAGQNLVIDLEFCDLMKPNEITSLIQQVMYSYAANGKAAVPGRISLTGARGDIRAELEKISGFNNWLVHKDERSYEEVFRERHSDLVYLTADSENILESLDSAKIYIIGGLVDRNRWKSVTLEKATRQGIATAKLPIGDHMKMMSSQVLTVNQVMELLLCFLELKDWKKALMRVVPPRKRAAQES